MTGELIIIAGPMRCDDAVLQGSELRRLGKTSAAIRLIWAAQDGDTRANCAFQPAGNTRDGAKFTAKSGEWIKATQEPDAESLAHVDTLTSSVCKSISFEEAHLWGDPRALLCSVAGALGRGIHVSLIGVDVDHMREPFERAPMVSVTAPCPPFAMTVLLQKPSEAAWYIFSCRSLWWMMSRLCVPQPPPYGVTMALFGVAAKVCCVSV